MSDEYSAELATDMHVDVFEWPRQELEGKATELVTTQIDEILNGQAELLGREKVTPTVENLIDRYGIQGMETYRKKMDTFHDDLIKMTPSNAEEKGIEKPVKLNHWSTTEDSYQDGKKRWEYHFLAYTQETNDVIAHYTWSTLKDEG